MKRLLSLLLIVVSVSLAAVELPPRGPILTTAAIVSVYNDSGVFQGILLIERGKEPFGYALPGGKVEYGESVETAVRRELFEETHVALHDLSMFNVYSTPDRDPRWHSVEVTHIAWTSDLPEAGDDAAKAFVCPIEAIPYEEMAFDHAQILRDYLKSFSRKIGSLNPFGIKKKT